MAQDTERISYLLDQFAANTATEQEVKELFALLKEADEILIKAKAEQLWKEYRDGEVLPDADWEKMYACIVESQVIGHRTKKQTHFSRIAAAAAILVAIATTAYFFLNRTPQSDLAVEEASKPVIQDIAPPNSANAILTLDNGEKIILDSAGNGALAMQGTTNVIKLADGQIVYNDTGTGGGMQYNTLTVPRGSKIAQITLADGTTVWLNSESSLKYPVSFIGNERKVEITGEAYFEITQDASKQFIVIKGETSIQVSGTDFNVNAYDDENTIKVTLLEGSVKVTKGNSSNLVKPGQQAQVTNEVNVVNGVDLGEVMAWKNGLFEFNGNIQGIMRQIARWYNAEVIYSGDVTGKAFGGAIARKEYASQVLRMLELTGSIHFKIEGNKITVMP